MEAPEHRRPLLDVAALQAAHVAPVFVGEGVEVAILHADDVGVAEREVGVERDQGPQRLCVVRRGLDHCPAAVEEVPAHADQEGREHRLLSGEVAVDRRPADADRCPQVFDGHSVESPVGEEFRCSVEEGGATVGFGLAALGRAGAVDDLGHVAAPSAGQFG